MPENRFKNQQHNHYHCINEAMQKAFDLCEQKQLRFTPIRRKVLELVWAQHTPVPAYELLEGLRISRHNAQAPTVYRALDFLIEHGLVHKIESLNAYVGCTRPGQSHPGQFLICINCQQSVELDDSSIGGVIAREALNNHFTITEQTIELKGYCKSCKP